MVTSDNIWIARIQRIDKHEQMKRNFSNDAPYHIHQKSLGKTYHCPRKKEIHRKKALSLLTIIKDACKNRVTKLQILLTLLESFSKSFMI